VKNAPYSAEAVSESTRTLADGNRITRKTSSLVYRDGEGRTRREETLTGVGPWAAQEAHKTILLNDPVAGVNYILDPDKKTAEKIATPPGSDMRFLSSQTSAAVPPVAGAVAVRKGIAASKWFDVRMGHGVPAGANPPDLNTESLGTSIVEGVQAEGTRTTHTIPAGHIGNDRPIAITTERWFSPELQTVVMSKTVDPMSGESTYKLQNIRRGEPGQDLFTVPPEYTVTEMQGPRHFMREKIEPPAQ
jgi:hypothetical protein